MLEATVADTFEPPDLPSAETRLAQAAGARNAAEAQLVALIADALEADSWCGHGVRSIEHWITWKLGASPGRARRYLAIARRRRDLPTAHALFDRGRLSVDQMVLIARRCPTEYECSVSEFAVLATIPQLARCLRDYHFDYENPGPGPGTEESNAGADPREDRVPEPEAPAPIQGEVSFSLDEDTFSTVASRPIPRSPGSAVAASPSTSISTSETVGRVACTSVPRSLGPSTNS